MSKRSKGGMQKGSQAKAKKRMYSGKQNSVTSRFLVMPGNQLGTYETDIKLKLNSSCVLAGLPSFYNFISNPKNPNNPYYRNVVTLL